MTFNNKTFLGSLLQSTSGQLDWDKWGGLCLLIIGKLSPVLLWGIFLTCVSLGVHPCEQGAFYTAGE